MSEFENKLRAMYGMQYVDADITFEQWLIEHAEREHKKSVQMAGDLGKALSQIGELDRRELSWVKEMREIIETPSIQDIRGEARSFFEIMRDLVKEREGLREAMQEFVDRCDRGEVRSKHTYAKFKKLLNNE